MTNEELAIIIESRAGEEGVAYRAWISELLEQHTAPLIDGLLGVREETDMRGCRGTAERALDAFDKQQFGPTVPLQARRPTKG